jgi:hypothetical protein
MKFQDLLMESIGRSEIPLRFEPGAEESVAKPVMELLEAWISAHLPENPVTDFDRGKRSVVVQLLAELSGSAEL